MGTAGIMRKALPPMIGCWLVFLVSGRILGQEAEKVEQLLISVLQQQAADWNRGDIDAFMRAYWKSENLTFCSGGTTNRGWTATRDRYLSEVSQSRVDGPLNILQI